MSGYLLDTNVVSMFAPGKPEPSAALKAWIVEKGAADALFISAITVAEIEKGIRKLFRKGSTVRAEQLQQWLQGILMQFEDRILPFDATAAKIAGELDDHAEGQGFDPGLADIVIAATAIAHGLTVVSQNTRHFEPLGVRLQSPLA